MRLAAALLAATALAAVGCGGGSDEDARELLKRGFGTDVETGVLSVDAELELDGLEQLDGPLRLELEGPFRAAGSPTEVPDADMELRASGAGQELEGRVILTRENAWVEFEGTAYEAGEELWARARAAYAQQSRGGPRSFEEAGVEPLDWIDDAETTGEEEIAGTPTTKVRGSVDVERMLRDFNRLGNPDAGLPQDTLDQVRDYVDEVDFEAWIGEDGIWRRISTETEFEVPEAQRDAAGGLSGGRVSLDMQLDEPNEPVEIGGPAEARPIEELLRRLGIPPELLLGPGFAQPQPG